MSYHFTDADGEQLHVHAGHVDAATGQPLPSSERGITVTAQDRNGAYVPVFIPLARVDELLTGVRGCARQAATPAAPVPGEATL
jgi:hypothetical protein